MGLMDFNAFECLGKRLRVVNNDGASNSFRNVISVTKQSCNVGAPMLSDQGNKRGISKAE